MWFPKSRLEERPTHAFGMRLSLHLSLPALGPVYRLRQVRRDAREALACSTKWRRTWMF
jgi:hypothetical protein